MVSFTLKMNVFQPMKKGWSKIILTQHYLSSLSKLEHHDEADPLKKRFRRLSIRLIHISVAIQTLIDELLYLLTEKEEIDKELNKLIKKLETLEPKIKF